MVPEGIQQCLRAGLVGLVCIEGLFKVGDFALRVRDGHGAHAVDSATDSNACLFWLGAENFFDTLSAELINFFVAAFECDEFRAQFPGRTALI